MFNQRIDRRNLVTVVTIALLSACKSIPTAKPPVVDTGPPPPSANALPTDVQRHRIALLLPLTGVNAAVGQSIANATTMALLDTNAQNLRITSYDTAAGAAGAAAKAIADGNKLILGPLMSEDIPAVVAAARSANMPVISYSNDEARAARDIFVMGSLPSQSINRTLTYAKAQGINKYAAIIPAGEYGQRASASLMANARGQGSSVVGIETYDRTTGSVANAARRLRARTGYDAVLIADGGRISAQVGPLIKPPAATGPRIMGTELWSGESAITVTPALRGAWYSAVSDARWRQFSESYRNRFGATPYRIATMGYDSVLLTLRIAREWKPGTTFPTGKMFDTGGFLGLDGPFRFRSSGAIERALEVREVRAGGAAVVSPAPTRFDD
jgi:branched-chain amino acid transport system substrate-binding protein